MAYLGNNLQAAFSSYKIIDDISASFNSSTTSFPLTVNGIAPVPSPINAQQCLISVGGVPQEPDSSGVDGFNLVGGNIVFSSAPKAGLKFWGVILAGSDYVTAGTAYPNGSAIIPSITFSSNTNTGLYLSAPNVLGFAANGASVATLSSLGLSLRASATLKLNGSVSGSVSIAAPASPTNNTLTLPTGNGANGNVLSTNGAGTLSWALASSGASLQVFTTTGTGIVYTPTAGKTTFLVFATGGGGGGGSAYNGGAAGGGGGGGTAVRLYTSAQMGSTATITVGGGGTAGQVSVPSSGGNGVATVFTPSGSGVVITGASGGGSLVNDGSTDPPGQGGAGGGTTNSQFPVDGCQGTIGALSGSYPAPGVGGATFWGGGRGRGGNGGANSNGSAGTAGGVFILEF